MKLVELIICILGISLVSSCTDCSGNRHTPASLEPPGNLTCLVDALPPATELGMVVASTYVGGLSDGAYCVLAIFACEYSGAGYSLCS